MKRLIVASLIALCAAICTSDTASAQQPGFNTWQPYGFYQPYGARYGNSIRTPPYFATNPPVYYGARHSRPYGVSPFASPPVVSGGSNYESRPASQFQHPRVPTPAPQCNPCVSHSKAPAKAILTAAKPKAGAVQLNPYVERLAKK